jgi:hypothetical protein
MRQHYVVRNAPNLSTCDTRHLCPASAHDPGAGFPSGQTRSPAVMLRHWIPIQSDRIRIRASASWNSSIYRQARPAHRTHRRSRLRPSRLLPPGKKPEEENVSSDSEDEALGQTAPLSADGRPLLQKSLRCVFDHSAWSRWLQPARLRRGRSGPMLSLEYEALRGPSDPLGALTAGLPLPGQCVICAVCSAWLNMAFSAAVMSAGAFAV